jgi:hypothetical protein
VTPRTDQFRVGVCQSLQSDRLPLAELDIFIMPAAFPVFFRNLSMLFFRGADHSGLIEQ